MPDLGTCSREEWNLALPGLKHPDESRWDLAPLQEYEAATRKMRSSKHVPGCCSIAILGDQVLHVGSFGQADLEHSLPMTTDSIMRLYCLTKPMIATALMTLVERGKCELDDPVEKFLPEFAGICVCANPSNLKATSQDHKTKRPLTLRRLLTHSSGIGYGAVLGSPAEDPAQEAYNDIVKGCDSGRIRSLKELSKEIAALPLRFHPGDKYYYSYGLDIAGRVIEVISGKPLDVFLKDHIFGPAGMCDTGFSVPPAVASTRLAALYATPENRDGMGERAPRGDVKHKTPFGTVVRVDGSRPTLSAWVKGRSCPVFSGGGIMGQNRGGMVSTLADQARFYLMLLRGGRLSPKHPQILKPATIEYMWSSDWLPNSNAVGRPCREGKQRFGWHALGEICVVKRKGHYDQAWEELGEWGMAGAACTHVTVVPKRKLLCLWFTQSLAGWPGWHAPEQNLWIATRKVVDAVSAGTRRPAGKVAPVKRKKASDGSSAGANPHKKRRQE